jgi:pantoate--beta-alanine ligase
VIRSEGHPEVRELLDAHRAAGRSVGVVGTSGGTHQGHLSLVRAARRDCDVVAVFWNGAVTLDWASGIVQHYTRDLERDAKLFEEAGVDLLYIPTRDDLYRRQPVSFVEMPAMAAHLAGMPEGRHMNILVTMVLTLLNIAGPCAIYFGEKDWQQLVMFQRMAEDLRLPSRVLASPTVREADGLAVSSRNTRLSPAERDVAPELHRALTDAVAAVQAGERDAGVVTGIALERLRRVSVPDYVVAVEADTLRPLDTLRGEVRLLASARFGDTPLVDNVGITVPAPGGESGDESGDEPGDEPGDGREGRR